MAHQEPMPDNAQPLRGSNSLHPRKEDLAAVEPGAPGNTGRDRSRSTHQQSQRGQQNMTQESNISQQQSGKTSTDTGLGNFPISDLQFDVVTLVHEKSKALQAYELYKRDTHANKEL